MLIDIFFNLSKNRKNKYKASKKLSIINLLWAITFIVSNTIEYGTVLKLLNIIFDIDILKANSLEEVYLLNNIMIVI